MLGLDLPTLNPLPRAATAEAAAQHPPSALAAATAQALTEGGDGRIQLSPAGTNRYGCPPQPDALLSAWGSSTASVVSEAGFAAVMALQARLQAHPHRWAAETRRLKRELLALSGATGVPGTQLVLGASGTDLHLIATQLMGGDHRRPLQALMAEPAETGSSVPAALSARHFETHTCQGQPAGTGLALNHTPLPAPACVALRHADGRPRSSPEVDAEFTAQAERIVHSGGRCLLVLTDVSKTGLIAPSLACALQLRARLGDALDVLVDACQFRLAPATLCSYLQHGCMVAITGSKFVTGPAFCGALLLPPALAQRCASQPLQALTGYSCRSHWPEHWPSALDLPDTPNLGLLLRWEAALTELRRLRAVPEPTIEAILKGWGQAVARGIAQAPHLHALPVPALQRPGMQVPSWDQLQTIYPVLLLRPDGQPLSPKDTARVHQQLQRSDWTLGRTPYERQVAALRFQLGQPVACGHRAGQPLSALRICASARSVADAAASGQGPTLMPIGALFDKLTLLMRQFERTV